MTAKDMFAEFPKPTRKGLKLTEAAEIEYEWWECKVEVNDGCYCNPTNAPCSVCEHPGHPEALLQDDSMWEPAVDFLALNKEFSSR